MRTAIEGHEFLSFKLEARGQDRSLRPRPRVSAADNVSDLGILEDGDVEVHRLFGFAIEPQKGGDLLHTVRLLFVKGFSGGLPNQLPAGMGASRKAAIGPSTLSGLVQSIK